MQTIILILGFLLLVMALKRTQDNARIRLKYGAILFATVLIAPLTVWLFGMISESAATNVLYVHAMLVLSGTALIVSALLFKLIQRPSKKQKS